MGYGLPSAIGAAIATKRPVICMVGDGGFQMNIQELQTVIRENLPIKIILFNNHALGMIHHFQEMYFQSNYYQTMSSGGYTVPDFGKIADAYGIEYYCIAGDENMDKWKWDMKGPKIIEISLENVTYVFPKLEYGRPNQDQEPLLDRKMYDELMKLGETKEEIALKGYENLTRGGL